MKAITGFHAIEEYIRSGRKNCALYITGASSRHEKLSDAAANQGIEVFRVDKKEIEKISGDPENRGAALMLRGRISSKNRFDSLKTFAEKLENENSVVLLLDSITDPHNFGAILRSADQFGADIVVIPGRRSVSENMTVRKTSAGASEYVPVVVENLSRSIDILKKNSFWVYGAEMDGSPCWSENLKGRVALVLGSEGKGISRLLLDKCDRLVKIPAQGNIDSFNVSVAAGILLYEISRQQNFA